MSQRIPVKGLTVGCTALLGGFQVTQVAASQTLLSVLLVYMT